MLGEGARTPADAERYEHIYAAAIEAAVAWARPGDIVLVAGKGHEAGQEIDGVKHPFDDREVVARALESRAGVAPGAVAEGER